MNVPNLDAMTNEELGEFSNAVERLATLARTMERARVMRAHGNIEDALREEQYAERLFARLPAEWKW